MSAPVRIALFAGGLVLAFGAAFVLGGAIDPDGADDSAPTHVADAHSAGSSGGGDDVSAPARVVVDDTRLARGATATVAFRVVDREGRAIEDFDVEHEREMHLIAARHDLTGYQHLHPRRGDGGRWVVEASFPQSGPHRLYADFASGGQSYTLTADVEVDGRYEPRPLPAPADTATAGDGYEVEMSESGDERRFTVTRDGRPVDDIEPYLGARGHLVALREGSLGFQHVHPTDGETAGREINFGVTLPRGGRYRMFLQFRHDRAVHTAAFTEVVDSKAPAHGEDGHGH